MKLKAIAILLTALLLGGCGITGNHRSDPGYADFDFPGWLESDREMALSLGRLPLKIAAWALDEDDDEAADLIRGLKGVRIYIFEFERSAARTQAKMAEAGQHMVDDGWQKLMVINDDSEQTWILARPADNGLSGLTVMSSDDSEAVFINLIGNIQPEQFNTVMRGIDADVDVELDEESLATAANS